MTDSGIFQSFIPEALEGRLQEGIRHAQALGAEGAEAFVSVSRSRRAKVQNGALEDLTTSKRGGLGVRVLRGGAKGVRTGIATTTDLTRADFRDLFAQAWELSALGDEDPWTRQAEPAGADDLPSRYDGRGQLLAPEDRIRRALDLEAEARRASQRVVAVREASWADGEGASLLLTQKGVRAFDLGSSCSGSIELAVEADGDRQAAWHWDIGRHPGALDLAAIGREAALKGERKLRPAQVEAGRYSVVLHPEVTVDILGIVAGMLSAEAVLKKRSLFADKLGERIASPLLTLVDDGRLPDGLGSEPWDGEGLPTRRNVLIQDGVLGTYLHTLRTAAEMGVAPTATAGRGTGSNPGVTTFNLFPERGATPVAELYRKAGDGILITELMGLHTVDPVSGDLSVGASGIRIRGGELAESVDRMTFAGNLRDFLTRIEALGDDLHWYGSSAGLSMLLADMSIGG
ncbi:TldD/PmbA family protein [Mesoterricola sediminis]|uniref:Peptidase C69 n=1 Tax=Mesoterricola sediminis TaxID=2927980 RepID=A0AA48KG47_9BACT|nr:TldD/PmbA family protein [Mesoterricola sediminis]BDU77078.1 peptidase C69 [Mesoterricola sediminis]